jgi:hypothetical protein
LKLGMHRCVVQKSGGVLDGGVLLGALGADCFGGLLAVGAPTAVWRQSRAIWRCAVRTLTDPEHTAW